MQCLAARKDPTTFNSIVSDVFSEIRAEFQGFSSTHNQIIDNQEIIELDDFSDRNLLESEFLKLADRIIPTALREGFNSIMDGGSGGYFLEKEIFSDYLSPELHLLEDEIWTELPYFLQDACEEISSVDNSFDDSGFTIFMYSDYLIDSDSGLSMRNINEQVAKASTLSTEQLLKLLVFFNDVQNSFGSGEIFSEHSIQYLTNECCLRIGVSPNLDLDDVVLKFNDFTKSTLIERCQQNNLHNHFVIADNHELKIKSYNDCLESDKKLAYVGGANDKDVTLFYEDSNDEIINQSDFDIT
ncbi:MAG: hypothetical protein ACRC17_08015 [Culicoidibacterales bacterium]